MTGRIFILNAEKLLDLRRLGISWLGIQCISFTGSRGKEDVF